MYSTTNIKALSWHYKCEMDHLVTYDHDFLHINYRDLIPVLLVNLLILYNKDYNYNKILIEKKHSIIFLEHIDL